MQFLQTCYVGFGSPLYLKSLKSIVCTCKGLKICGWLSHNRLLKAGGMPLKSLEFTRKWVAAESQLMIAGACAAD